MSRELDIYKIVKIGLKAMKRAKIPLYWSKYSRNDYTIRQHNMSWITQGFRENLKSHLAVDCMEFSMLSRNSTYPVNRKVFIYAAIMNW